MTTEQTLLYHYVDENISVIINIFFKQGNLMILGIDKGPVVLHKTGKASFKYSLTITAENTEQLYNYLNINNHDSEQLIEYFTEKYAINTCISEIGTLLNKSNIPFEYHSWH